MRFRSSTSSLNLLKRFNVNVSYKSVLYSGSDHIATIRLNRAEKRNAISYELMDGLIAAYAAGCRRFDSVIGGLGGCPFAQDEMIGNIPTEIAVEALKDRGADVQLKKPLDSVVQMSADIAKKHTVVM